MQENENESENRKINIINFGFLSFVSKLFDSIELLIECRGNKKQYRVHPYTQWWTVFTYVHVYQCAAFFSVPFASLIRFTSNTIFVQFIIARCLFCFNKLPQNEFAITCSISSAIISPIFSSQSNEEVDKFRLWKYFVESILVYFEQTIFALIFAIKKIGPISGQIFDGMRKKQQQNIYQLKNVCNWKYICYCYVY